MRGRGGLEEEREGGQESSTAMKDTRLGGISEEKGAGSLTTQMKRV